MRKYMNILKKISKEKMKNNNEKCNRWLRIMVVKEGEKKERKKEKKKKGNVASGKWDVWESWCEINKKNKCFMYLSICGIKLMCILSFTFESNCETNLKALLECMNRQYFFSSYIKIKKVKAKF